MGGTEVFSENSFELFQKHTFYTLCTWLKEIVEEIWNHAADRDAQMMIAQSGYIIGDFESAAQSVFKNRK